uniref:Glyco_transf_7N domain-containing protein n=1 Tax=Schistocephalus solidus TaxID=70667 RepID=A0A183SQD4_SCHSO
LPLVRRLKVDQSPVTFEQLEQEWGEGALPRYFGLHNQLKLDSPYQLTPLDNVTAVEHRGGGVWNPVNCRAQQTVAIIMPFRDRYDNLTVFLKHIHPFLRHQKIAYTIFVVEQRGQTLFNRASLLNVGFIEAMKRFNYSCLIFHDVDLLPEDDRNLYMCDDEPTHLSATISKFNYT